MIHKLRKRPVLRVREETIQVRSNLKLVARERGKIVARREGHNIWVNLGREWLSELVGYGSYSGDAGVPERSDRIRWMAVGIGGNRQVALGVANANPLLTDYPGTNVQSDVDPTLRILERPVRVGWTTGSPSAPPYDAGDVWFAQVAGVTHPTATDAKFTVVFGLTDVNGGGSEYPTVPLSEIGLFTDHVSATRHVAPSATNPTQYANAYDTFDSISKTVGIQVQADWILHF